MTFTDLAGKWTLSDNSGDYTCNMHLPGDGITALHDAGLDRRAGPDRHALLR